MKQRQLNWTRKSIALMATIAFIACGYEFASAQTKAPATQPKAAAPAAKTATTPAAPAATTAPSAAPTPAPAKSPVATVSTEMKPNATTEEMVAQIEALKDQGDFAQARTLAQQYAEKSADPMQQQILEEKVAEYRRLARRALEFESAMDLIKDNPVEAAQAPEMLLDGSDVSRILLCRAVRIGTPILAGNASRILVAIEHASAFDAMLARYTATEPAQTQLRADLENALRALSAKADAKQLAALYTQVKADNSFAARNLAGILLSIGDNAAIDAKLGAGASTVLTAYIKKAYASGGNIAAWALNFSVQAGLAVPGIRGEWWPNQEMMGTSILVRVEKKLEWPNGIGSFPIGQAENISACFTADLSVPTTGEYTFFTTSDDGSRLFIDEKMIVDNWGGHGMDEKSGKLSLTAGKLYKFKVLYNQGSGGSGLLVQYAGPDGKKLYVDGSIARSLPNK